MKRRSALLALWLLSGALLLQADGGPPSTGPQTEAGRLPQDQAQKVRGYIEATLKRWDVPGAAVAIVKEGKAVFLEGFGKRDLERGLPVTPQTRFIDLLVASTDTGKSGRQFEILLTKVRGNLLTKVRGNSSVHCSCRIEQTNPWIFKLDHTEAVQSLFCHPWSMGCLDELHVAE